MNWVHDTLNKILIEINQDVFAASEASLCCTGPAQRVNYFLCM